MKARRMRVWFLTAAMAALLLCGSAAATIAQGNESERWLTVEVTDAAGQPLKHACVTVVPREGEIIFRNADSRGRVKLKKPRAGSYRVVVKVEGYEAQKREVTLGERSERVAFALQPRAN